MELARKLLLSGLISVVGRGTVVQAATAAMISFFFFALSVKVEPFKSRALNGIKILSEVQLFVVLLVCVILQTQGTRLDAEMITTAGYGAIQKVATLVIVPAIAWMVLYNARALRDDLKDLKEERRATISSAEMENPVSEEVTASD